MIHDVESSCVETQMSLFYRFIAFFSGRNTFTGFVITHVPRRTQQGFHLIVLEHGLKRNGSTAKRCTDLDYALKMLKLMHNSVFEWDHAPGDPKIANAVII